MSYEFDLNGETIWDAGFSTGRLYLELAIGVSKVLEVPCGLTADEQKGSCDIELKLFKSFTEGLYETYSKTQNIVLRGLIGGALATSLVLLEQAGSEITLRAEDADSLRQEMAKIRRAMG